jgi:ATP-dependent Clp protease ATP-binding subunit ClpC
MREEMTGQLRVAMSNAQSAARRLNQDFVGSEHLLLGILSADNSEAARAIRKDDVPLLQMRAKMEKKLPRGEKDPVVTGDLPLSPKAQRAFHAALVKAQSLHEPRISTRMLLLALLDDPETAIRDAIRASGADVDHLVAALTEKPREAEE